ncbi:DoxX protein [Chryseobacterium oleae]|uniref:DoxX protein n=2 Tax=Chryseobacterium group TaxID=2782232 RepID=A0A1I4X9I1_CHROL|nr:DoxX protein [Chryseobacterium oleae]
MLLKANIMTDKNVQFPQLFLRLAISVTMLSAVADRFGFWGKNSAWGNWENFETYTRKLTFFLPEGLSTFSAYTATFFEILFPLMLLIGWKTRIGAYGAGFLLLVFALSMTMALGVKAPLDYSVWVGSAGAFLLAVQPKYSFSIDHLTNKNK